MYKVSDTALQLIRGDDRSFEWFGTITLSSGRTVDYTMDNIVQGTGSIRASCSAPGIGGTVSRELTIQMYLDIDVELLKEAEIEMQCRVLSEGSASIETWGDADDHEWSDVNGSEWGDSSIDISQDIPIGVFKVDQAKRTQDSVKIVAYDNMKKFDIPFKGLDNFSQSGYAALQYLCNRCKVDVGISRVEFDKLPNHSRMFTFANVNQDIKTFRDVLSAFASAFCAVAVMDRKGKLTLVPCVSDPVRTLTPDDRFSSEFEDYKTSFTGLYLQYKAGGVQEYYSVAAEDTGSIIDLGANPFLQFSEESTRKQAAQNIISKFSDFPIIPFEVSIPCDPTLDLIDVIQFTGTHAPSNAMAPITDMTIKINGDMTLRCDVDETASGLIRDEQDIEGISGDGSSGTSYGGGDFWLKIDSWPLDWAQMYGEELDTNSVAVKLGVDRTRTQITWTATYTIDQDTTVTARAYCNDELIYTASEDQNAGQRTFTLTTGHEVEGDGDHKFKVTFGTADNTVLIVMKTGSARLTVLGVGWDETSVDSGKGWTEEGEVAKDIGDTAGIPNKDDEDWDEVARNNNLSQEDIKKDNGKTYVKKEKFDKVKENLEKEHGTGTGTNPNIKDFDGEPYVELGSDTGSAYPASIKVTTYPDKTLYDSGEDIDTTGMVVTAYDINGNVWTSSDYPDGTVPLSEITLDPTVVP